MLLLLLLSFLWQASGFRFKEQQGARLLIVFWYLQVVGGLVITGSAAVCLSGLATAARVCVYGGQQAARASCCALWLLCSRCVVLCCAVWTGNWVYEEGLFPVTAFISFVASFKMYAAQCLGLEAWWDDFACTMIIPPAIVVLAAALYFGMTKSGFASATYVRPRCLHIVLMVWEFWYLPGAVRCVSFHCCGLGGAVATTVLFRCTPPPPRSPLCPPSRSSSSCC